MSAAAAIPLDLDEKTLNRTMFRVSLPVIIEQLLITAVFFADMIIIGRLRDEVALAGSMIGSVVMWVSTTPFVALGTATASLVARRWGANLSEEAKRIGGQSVAVSFLGALTMALLIWPLTHTIGRWMGAEPDVVQLGGDYMRIVLITAPLGLPMIVANAALRGSGDTRTPMITTLMMNICNIVVSTVLAFGYFGFPAMGLLGVAVGTATARAFGALLVAVVLFSKSRAFHLRACDVFQWSAKRLREIFGLATPAMGERFINSLAHTVMIKYVAIIGTTALAAHNMAINVESLCFMVANGIGASVTTLCGQAIGSGRRDTAVLIAKRAAIASSVIMFVLGTLFVLFAPWAVAIFKATPESLRLAGLVLQISALELPVLSLSMVYSGALNAAGDTRSPLFINAICIVIFRFGVVYLMALYWGWGLPGVWLGTALFWSGRSLLLWLTWRSGRWKNLKA